MTQASGRSSCNAGLAAHLRLGILLLAFAAAFAGYRMIGGHTRFSQRDALRQEILSGDYAAAVGRIVAHPSDFHSKLTQTAADNFRYLAGRSSYPAVPPGPRFFRRQAFYRSVAATLLRPTRRETILAAFEFVVREIPPVAGPGEQEDVGVPPDTILLRGYGACDRSAWALCTLLENLGIRACVIYLRDPQTGISHHTIAAAEFGGLLYLLDTWAGVPVTTTAGRCAAFDEVVADSATIDDASIGGRRQFVSGAEVANSIVLLPLEAASVHPITAAVQETLAGSGPLLYRDFRERLAHLGKMLFPGDDLVDDGVRLTAQGSNCIAAVWDYPFRIAHNGRLPDYARSVEEAHPWLRRCFDARWEHLAGSHEKEAAAYEELIRSIPAGDPAAIAAEYFRAACLLSHGADGGVEAAEAFLAKHTESVWSCQMLLALGEELAAKGDADRAVQYLDKVTGVRALRAAWLISRLREGRCASMKAEELFPQAGD